MTCNCSPPQSLANGISRFNASRSLPATSAVRSVLSNVLCNSGSSRQAASGMTATSRTCSEAVAGARPSPEASSVTSPARPEGWKLVMARPNVSVVAVAGTKEPRAEGSAAKAATRPSSRVSLPQASIGRAVTATGMCRPLMPAASDSRHPAVAPGVTVRGR